MEPTYVFVYGKSEDDTLRKLGQAKVPREIILASGEPPEWGAKRDWTPTRLEYMVGLRNQLLQAVVSIGPQYFLSLDSDILLHERMIARFLTEPRFPMGKTVPDPLWHALGGKCYMQPPPSRACPSYSKKGNYARIVRNDSTGTFPVKAIMAIKWMTPSAYMTPYEYHPDGEDIGWSNKVTGAGMNLKWIGDVTNKHVMSPHWLDKVDPRVGW